MLWNNIANYIADSVLESEWIETQNKDRRY